MKRIHLFEFEDLSWFPDTIRQCMTRLIVVMHGFLKSKKDLADLIDEALGHSKVPAVIDLCSGSGGPVPEMLQTLREKYGHQDLKIRLTDLYPNRSLAQKINNRNDDSLRYETDPVDATDLSRERKGVRTMICSMHHMKPDVARKILENAVQCRQPIVIYEISDNSAPLFLWWTAIPFNIIFSLFITPMVRPMTWQQLVFTYVIPVIPLCYAWDGAVSNARTYTLRDLDELLENTASENYRWKKGKIKGKVSKLYLLGWPT